MTIPIPAIPLMTRGVTFEMLRDLAIREIFLYDQSFPFNPAITQYEIDAEDQERYQDLLGCKDLTALDAEFEENDAVENGFGGFAYRVFKLQIAQTKGIARG